MSRDGRRWGPDESGKNQPTGEAGRNGSPRQQPNTTADARGTAGHQRRPVSNGHGNGPSHPTPRRGSETAVPAGLRFVAVTMTVLGGLLVVSALLLLTGGSDLPGSAGSTVQLIGLLSGGFGGAHLLAACGLWTVTARGYTLGLLLAAGSLVLSLLSLLAGSTGALLGIVLYGGMGWYLYTNEQLYRRLQHRSE